MAGCKQVNVPKIDNTEIACDEFNLSTCITVVEKSTKIGNLSGESLDQFIERLHNKISKMDNEIYILKKKIEILENNQGT